MRRIPTSHATMSLYECAADWSGLCDFFVPFRKLCPIIGRFATSIHASHVHLRHPCRPCGPQQSWWSRQTFTITTCGASCMAVHLGLRYCNPRRRDILYSVHGLKILILMERTCHRAFTGQALHAGMQLDMHSSDNGGNCSRDSLPLCEPRLASEFQRLTCNLHGAADSEYHVHERSWEQLWSASA